MATNAGDNHASVRAKTGTAYPYSGDWHALFNMASISGVTFNGRMLGYINQLLSTNYKELNGAMAAFAKVKSAGHLANSWGELGSWS